jgi:hypothetical protein
MTLWHALAGTLPAADVMGVVGILALVANAGVALMLFRFRTGDSNMRSVWICSRNDAIGNIAVIAAAAGVFGTGSGWPDVIVAAIMASLSISGGCPRFVLCRLLLRFTRQPGTRRHLVTQWRGLLPQAVSEISVGPRGNVGTGCPDSTRPASGPKSPRSFLSASSWAQGPVMDPQRTFDGRIASHRRRRPTPALLAIVNQNTPPGD